ncbi:hypothetical protein SNOG_02260 [Parastagonospora nodorum SN15]|uniref:Uncharacterized protein n=1 Tax=Phaeosphaeria nodorum (strain SN15 / ATCC MYA-4574 / FGSC 10173) TaxID=321614 RepID=Q0V154_PHANO|nr:hypothetical protein SNOG_02260 [Parastagonospora nodorum SN15]EAT90472.1 hypothetical protein SNOG_02260 [Parastagonospora nodorum SN15]
MASLSNVQLGASIRCLRHICFTSQPQGSIAFDFPSHSLTSHLIAYVPRLSPFTPPKSTLALSALDNHITSDYRRYCSSLLKLSAPRDRSSYSNTVRGYTCTVEQLRSSL